VSACVELVSAAITLAIIGQVS